MSGESRGGGEQGRGYTLPKRVLKRFKITLSYTLPKRVLKRLKITLKYTLHKRVLKRSNPQVYTTQEGIKEVKKKTHLHTT